MRGQKTAMVISGEAAVSGGRIPCVNTADRWRISLLAALSRTRIIMIVAVGRLQAPHGTVRHCRCPRHTVHTTQLLLTKKGKGSPYSITERKVPEPIPVVGSQPAGDVSHKPDGRLPLLSARPAVTPATLKRAATNFGAW